MYCNCLCVRKKKKKKKCYQPRLRLITLTSTLIIPDITKTSSNNCLILDRVWPGGNAISHFNDDQKMNIATPGGGGDSYMKQTVF